MDFELSNKELKENVAKGFQANKGCARYAMGMVMELILNSQGVEPHPGPSNDRAVDGIRHPQDNGQVQGDGASYESRRQRRRERKQANVQWDKIVIDVRERCQF